MVERAVARGALRVHAEVVGLVADKLVEFLEGAFIEQQVNAFARLYNLFWLVIDDFSE